MTNRIEEIKKRWSRKNPGEFEWFTPTTLKEKQTNDVEHSWPDIEYLLAKLEIAEKALEQIHELDDGDPNVSLGRLAGEALKAIRE